LAVNADRETRTHWDHITGEAISGPLLGHQLEVWPVRMTTVAAALDEYKNITISFSDYRSFKKSLAQKLYPSFIHKKIWLPNFFYASMNSPIDSRLDKLTQGLGVIVDGQARYYPLYLIPSAGLDDVWLGRTLNISRGAMDGVPQARWKDTNEEPMQLLTRWYGFSFTYPQCEIYESSRNGFIPS
jgi:Protein of unknown function (DUF3179)